MTIHELKTARIKIGITQKQLSKMLKKDPTFICKLESGNRKFNHELQQIVKARFMKLRSAK